jgi:glycosyltransferase involved in cell wall biosynthesis
MTGTADVAVVICSRNRPDMLAHALAKLIRTTPREVRILVVDSASSTAETQHVATAAGVEFLRTDVRGLSIARNVGLRAAGRSIVVYTDDDCEPTEGWIDHILAAFANPDVGAVTGMLLDHSKAGSVTPGPRRRYTAVRRGLDAGHGALMAFRTDLIAGLGGFDEVLGAGRRFAGAEDLDMFCRVLASGRSIVHEPNSVVLHLNTREGDDYTKLLRGYGLGLGGLATKWLRLAPATGVQIAVVATGRTVVRLLRGLRSRRLRRAQLAMLGGILAGMAISLRFSLDGARFVDAHPPDATPLNDKGTRPESAQ